MRTSSLSSQIITAIHIFPQPPVHPAWINEFTTPIATSLAVLTLQGGNLIKVFPCEVEVDTGKYPSLGLDLAPCEPSVLEFVSPDGKTYVSEPLNPEWVELPFDVLRIEESDPLKEGAVTEIKLIGCEQEIIFRHILPPMTLGIDISPRVKIQ